MNWIPSRILDEVHKQSCMSCFVRRTRCPKSDSPLSFRRRTRLFTSDCRPSSVISFLKIFIFRRVFLFLDEPGYSRVRPCLASRLMTSCNIADNHQCYLCKNIVVNCFRDQTIDNWQLKSCSHFIEQTWFNFFIQSWSMNQYNRMKVLNDIPTDLGVIMYWGHWMWGSWMDRCYSIHWMPFY